MKKKAGTTNILFCGVGGQGVLTASEIAGVAAMLAGYRVKKSEVHGMSQRGGSVDSHLRFGKTVHSPLIKPGEADFLVPFNAEEGIPMRVFLKKDGLDLAVFLEKATISVPDRKFVNTYMLGVLSAFLPIGAETWLVALNRLIKRAHEENKAVFLQGANEGRQYDIQRNV